jgi:hypothetical protein
MEPFIVNDRLLKLILSNARLYSTDHAHEYDSLTFGNSWLMLNRMLTISLTNLTLTSVTAITKGRTCKKGRAFISLINHDSDRGFACVFTRHQSR